MTSATPAHWGGSSRSPRMAAANRMLTNGSRLLSIVARTGLRRRSAAKRVRSPIPMPTPAPAMPSQPTVFDGGAHAPKLVVSVANATLLAAAATA